MPDDKKTKDWVNSSCKMAKNEQSMIYKEHAEKMFSMIPVEFWGTQEGSELVFLIGKAAGK